MKRVVVLFLALFISLSLFSSSISFRGGESHLNLSEGKEEVVLSSSAQVIVDSMTIESDEITLSGSSWRYVRCSGPTVIKDEEKGFEIRTRSLYFDREEERLLLSSWFELDDINNELNASGYSMEYRMKDEEIRMDMSVMLSKVTDSGIMRCNAESVIFSRSNETLVLRGNSSVKWKGDEYRAEVISVDLDSDEIRLDGRIRGSING